jgi:hypothetical protein
LAEVRVSEHTGAARFAARRFLGPAIEDTNIYFLPEIGPLTADLP